MYINLECCNSKMSFIWCNDDGSNGNYCYNLYACVECGSLAKEDITARAHVVIKTDNEVSIRVLDEQYLYRD